MGDSSSGAICPTPTPKKQWTTWHPNVIIHYTTPCIMYNHNYYTLYSITHPREASLSTMLSDIGYPVILALRNVWQGKASRAVDFTTKRLGTCRFTHWYLKGGMYRYVKPSDFGLLRVRSFKVYTNVFQRAYPTSWCSWYLPHATWCVHILFFVLSQQWSFEMTPQLAFRLQTSKNVVRSGRELEPRMRATNYIE